MKTVHRNWTGAIWVECSGESADGSSGWDNEFFGPFFTLAEARRVAHALSPGSGRPRRGQDKLLVEIWRSLTDSVETDPTDGDRPGRRTRLHRREFAGV